jgi:hypothetical protein
MEAEGIAAIKARWERIAADYRDWPDDPTHSRSPALNPERAVEVAGWGWQDVAALLAEVEVAASHLQLMRERLAAVETAAVNLLDVFGCTGIERKRVVDALTEALVVDFRTAVICSTDMSEEQRRKWVSPDAPLATPQPQEQ